MKDIVIVRTVPRTTYQNIIDERFVRPQQMESVISKIENSLPSLNKIVGSAHNAPWENLRQ